MKSGQSVLIGQNQLDSDSIERDVLAVGRSWGSSKPLRLLTLRAELSYPVALFKNARHEASHLRQSVFDFQCTMSKYVNYL